jgi:hypothetical protein
MPRNPDQTPEMKARTAKLKADMKRRAKETAAWIKEFSQRPVSTVAKGVGTVLGVGPNHPDWRENVRKRDREKTPKNFPGPPHD